MYFKFANAFQWKYFPSLPQEGQLRISDLERRLQEAKDREKKDQIDQIRSLKSEVKSLLEKNDK